MAEAHILRTDSLPMVDRGNGIQTIPLVIKEIGSEHMTIGLARFPVGAKVPRHSHNSDEQVTILEGQAEAELDGRRHRLDADDTTLIPANKPDHFCERRHDAARDIVDLCLLGGNPNLCRDRRNRRSPVRTHSNGRFLVKVLNEA
jgi:quercetin dioxygenase-like cupin family protein